jgi:hypothetical protein
VNQPLKPLWIRLLKLLLLFGVTIYLVVCIAIAVSQRSLIYHPQVFSAAEVDQKAQIAKLERWTNSTGQFIGFKRPSPKQPVEGTILFLYGNGSTATGSAHYADDIQRAALRRSRRRTDRKEFIRRCY